MRHPLTWLLLAGLIAPAVIATPLVTGFERFHASHASAEGGRLLYHELGCINCHGGDPSLPLRRGPNLIGVTYRVQADWMRVFLTNPPQARAGTTMPHLLPAGEPGAAEAVVQYLASVSGKAPKPKVLRHVNVELGRELFHTIGCVACHAPQKDYEAPEGNPKPTDFSCASIAFPNLNAKHVLATLAEFILDPLKVRSDGRMPKIAMDDQDAVDIAGYLLGYEGSDGTLAPAIQPIAPDPTLAARGQQLVANARCAACHTLPKQVAVKTVAMRLHEGGCLSEQPAPGLPRYELSESQRAALKLFLAKSDEPISATDKARLTLEALNCLACHERDGKGGPDTARKAYFQGDHNLGDTGRYPPPLTGVGRKLQPAWMTNVLSGAARVRFYQKTRMPAFGAATDKLPTLLGTVDAKPARPLPDGDVEAGRKLLGTLGGVSCITCHRWGERESLGIHGMDLSQLAARIQPGWLQEYLLDPAGYRPGTLMPSFWPEGKAANQDILGGDTTKQIAAIYAFARSGKGLPDGFPATDTLEYELIPKEHPIVQRTFMEGVGTHAILVGFPEGVHLAYDGLNARPVLAWKGRFFDAYGTWFSRFAPFEKPLGTSIVKWPETKGDRGEVRFLGYRLDVKRGPTFLFTIGGTKVEETFMPTKDGLRRHVHWDAAGLKSIELRHPEGVTITEDTGSKPGDRIFSYAWK